MSDGDKHSEKKNAKQFPTVLYCKHMQPGVAKYEDETILVNTDAMIRMLPTGAGKPVYIKHADVNLDTMKEEACGYITDAFYNELDGWGWFKFLAIDDEAHEKIAEGWAVSNAYMPTEWAGNGSHINVPYNREVKNGAFTHLAIVPDPRYEGACIYTPDQFKLYQEQKRQQLDELKNSNPKPKGLTAMFFKREKKEVTEIDADTFVEIKNDKGEVTAEVSVKEMTEAVLNARAAKKNEADEDKDDKKEKENEGDKEVTVGDSKMKLSDLVSEYTSMKNKKNSEESDDKDDKKEKENESDADDDKKDDAKDDKKNSKSDDADKKGKKHFDELRNANKGGGEVITIETTHAQMQRGVEKYGKLD